MLEPEIVEETYKKNRKSFFKMQREDVLDIVKYMLIFNVSASEAKKCCGFDYHVSTSYFSELDYRAGFSVEFAEPEKIPEEELAETEKSVNKFKAKTAGINLKYKKTKNVLNSFAALAKLKKIKSV